MLSRILGAGTLAIALLIAGPDRAAAADVHVSVSIGAFHQRLTPYGEWVSIERYGECWRPRHVAHGWRPYTVGYWGYSNDDGWIWMSDEPFGWATYHYGRWFYDPYYGWIWVPGSRWAPAYVSWRYSDDWIGWAPLPPGIEPGVFVNVNLGPSAYSFVPTRDFLDRRLSGRYAPVSRNAVLIGSTRNATRFDVRSGHIVDRGVDPQRIERVSGRQVLQARTRQAPGAVDVRSANHERAIARPSAARYGGQTSRSPGVERAPLMRPPQHAQPQRLPVVRQQGHVQPQRAPVMRAERRAQPQHVESQHVQPQHAQPRHAQPQVQHAQPQHAQPQHARPIATHQSHPAPAQNPGPSARPANNGAGHGHAQPRENGNKHGQPKHEH